MSGLAVVADRANVAERIDRDGWALTPAVVPDAEVALLLESLSPIAAATPGRGGTRNLLELVPAIAELARSPAVRSVAESVLGSQCFAVRALYFDKTPDANWKVIWHQDLTIAVRREAPVLGYGPWSRKDGVSHAQAPVEILESMLAVRVHLDDCNEGNGPVRVMSGSHRVGRLSGEAIDRWKSSGKAVHCIAARGAILAFRPLILHASSPALTPSHRRVVHIEFSAMELAAPLEWHSRIA